MSNDLLLCLQADIGKYLEMGVFIYLFIYSLFNGAVSSVASKCRVTRMNSGLILFFYYWWGGTKSLGTAATSGLLYKPKMIDEDVVEQLVE
jgi:hypothetical protein